MTNQTAIQVTGKQGQFLGFVSKTEGGFFRSYLFIGIGVGPFKTAAEAVQDIWNSSTGVR